MTFKAVPFVLGLLVCGCGSEFVGTGPTGTGGALLTGDAGDGGSPETNLGGATGGGTGGSGGIGAAAGGGGVAGTSSSGGSTGACVQPSEEVCDGIDNDCDEVIDDHCVAALSIVLQEQLQPFGDPTGGGPFTDDCPRGQVLAGLQARMDAHLTQIQGLCRKLSVAPNAGAPSGYTLTLSAAPPLPPHPDMSMDPPSTLLCDADEALVGFRVALQDIPFGDDDGKATVITQLWVSCSKLVLVQRANGAIAIEADPVSAELAPACGSSVSVDALHATSTTPTGSLPTRLFGASGLWVDRIGLGVSEVQLTQ